jgi:hypothetical protein
MICCLLALLALVPGFAAVKANRACHARRQLRLTGMAVVFAAFLFGVAVVAHAAGPVTNWPSLFAPVCGLLGHAHAGTLYR